MHRNSSTCCSFLLTVFPLPLHVFVSSSVCPLTWVPSPWCEVPTAPVPQRILPLVWVTFHEELPSQHGASVPSQLLFLLKGISADGHGLPTPRAAHSGEQHHGAGHGHGAGRAAHSPTAHSHTRLYSTQLLCITQLKSVERQTIRKKKRKRKKAISLPLLLQH